MHQTNSNVISQSEFQVLTCLKTKIAERVVTTPTSSFEINEISSTTGIRDNEEVLRALYTLEGKNLVAPEPAGDFTSNFWRITDNGVKALRFVNSDPQ